MRRELMAFLGIIILFASAITYAALCGDVNNSGAVNIADITYLINWVYKAGPAPLCGNDCGDVDNSGTVNITDITYLINYLYKGGMGPLCGETGSLMDADGSVYLTVKIGKQWWMAENLKVTRYRNGISIPKVTDSATWGGLTSGAYCEYNNDINNIATYGRLYNWYCVNDSRNLAPEGWHVPSDIEWQILVDYLGGNAVAGGRMKEAGTTHWNSPNWAGTNESGFSGLPGGDRGGLGDYSGMGAVVFFWSATEDHGGRAWYRVLEYYYAGVGHFSAHIECGFAVRCVKD